MIISTPVRHCALARLAPLSTNSVKQYPYFLLLFFSAIVCLYRWRRLTKPDRYLALLIQLTLLTECLALYAAYTWKNNLPIYHFFNPVQFFIWSLYFNDSVRVLKGRSVGVFSGAAGVLLAVLNSLTLQHLTEINSYFLLYEGTVLTIYCLLAMREILLKEDDLAYNFVQFWITTCCLLFWSSTYTGWGLFEFFGTDAIVRRYFDTILTAANYLLYLGIAGSFFFYRRLNPTQRA